MLSLRVAIGPGVALLALLVVTSTRDQRARCCLLVEGLKLLLIIWIYRWLPLLVWIVRVVRHLKEEDDSEISGDDVEGRWQCKLRMRCKTGWC